MRVLIVEDDYPLRKIVSTILKEDGYEVEQAEDGEEGLFMATSAEYDLLILDIMMPGMDGYSLIRKLRKEGIHSPTLFLTAKDRVEDKVEGLDAGADDYLVKPFASQELSARVRSLLRRAGKLGVEGKISYGPLILDMNQHEAFVEDNGLNLTKKEYDLLHYLVQNKEQILTRDQIFERVWGIESDTSDAIVDLYIHYIRKKLSPFETDPIVHTIRGVGYMLKEKKNV